MGGFIADDIERLLNERLEDRIGDLVQVTMKEDPDLPGVRWVCAPQWIREVHDDHIIIASRNGVHTRIWLEYIDTIEFVGNQTIVHQG